MKSFQRGVASFRTAFLGNPNHSAGRRSLGAARSALLINSVSTEYGPSVWMSCSLPFSGFDADTKSESVPFTWKLTGVLILWVKFSAPSKLQFSEPPTSIVRILPSVFLMYASSMRFLAPDGMTGQKVAKIPILPTLVSKKNPVAGTPPSGSTLLET